MATMTVTKNMNLGGVNFSENLILSGDIQHAVQVSVPVAQPATLTTRTNGTDGTLTMTNSGHGISTGQRIDLYWAGGFAYGVTVGTVSGTSVPFTGAVGTTLPSTSTVINVGIATKRTFTFTGNNLKLLAAFCDIESQFIFVDSGDAELLAYHNKGAKIQDWYFEDTNPLAGDAVASVWMSHGDTAAIHNCTAGFLSN